MAIPSLTSEDINLILDEIVITNVGQPIQGGQKLVVPIITQNGKFLAKFIEVKDCGIFSIPGDDQESIEDATLGRLKREISILSTCNCENIVKIYSDGLKYKEYRGQHIYYYIEEFIEGIDINQLITQKYIFSVDEIFNFAICINNAIDCLWGFKIIHRDIKPQNIIYDTKNSRFVLIDPGIAFDLSDISYTQTGTVVGTKFFMSPEQHIHSLRRHLDFRSDHFLLGLCLYCISTGMHPFFMDARNDQDVIYNIIHKKQVPAYEINPSIPIELSIIIDRLLSKEMFKRYRTPALLEQDLIKAKGVYNDSLHST